jgi:uncharacterized protein (TIGR02453 family)
VKFSGFPTTAKDFYDDLESDNSKTFWAAHKEVYETAVRAPMEALVAELASEFGAGKLFRPYRDVRFAKDKTPYKTHQGAWFDESSVYVQISAAGLFVAGGYWRTSPEQISRLRRAVGDDVVGPALEKALKAVRSKGFEVGGQQLTRVPTGFAKDHPRAELLRHKTLVAHRELGFGDWLATAKARGEVVKAWRALAPLNSWLATHVGRA